MLLLFGVRPASLVVAAVVIYRAISLWVPALIGSVAFLSLRREIGKPGRDRRRRARLGAGCSANGELPPRPAGRRGPAGAFITRSSAGRLAPDSPGQ